MLVLFSQLLLQALSLFLIVLLNLLLIVIELLYLVVKGLYFLHLSREDFLMVLFQLEVVHLRVAHVTHSMELWISSGQSTPAFTANFANAFATALAMSDWILSQST